MHLGRALADAGGERAQAGASAKRGQPLEHLDAGLGGLHALAPITGAGGGGGRNGIGHGRDFRRSETVGRPGETAKTGTSGAPTAPGPQPCTQATVRQGPGKPARPRPGDAQARQRPATSENGCNASVPAPFYVAAGAAVRLGKNPIIQLRNAYYIYA
ncbi:hypothetical protein GCM10025795_24970 [Verticiella sediminum]